MTDDIPAFLVGAAPPKRTPIEEHAAAVAQRAQDWLHAQNPAYPAWEDLADYQQASVIHSAMVTIAFVTAINDKTAGAH